MRHDTFDIGFDLDGCAYDFIDVMAKEVKIQEGRDVDPALADSWGFYQRWGLSNDDFQRIYAEGVNAGRVLWDGDPYPGVVDAWQRLAEEGHRIHVVTDRSPAGAVDAAHDATRAWLRRHDLPYETLTFTPDKTRIMEHADRLETTFFVDDRSENHVALQRAGIRSYLLDRPWNQHAPGPRVMSIHHYSTLVQTFYLSHVAARAFAEELASADDEALTSAMSVTTALQSPSMPSTPHASMGFLRRAQRCNAPIGSGQRCRRRGICPHHGVAA